MKFVLQTLKILNFKEFPIERAKKSVQIEGPSLMTQMQFKSELLMSH